MTVNILRSSVAVEKVVESLSVLFNCPKSVPQAYGNFGDRPRTADFVVLSVALLGELGAVRFVHEVIIASSSSRV